MPLQNFQYRISWANDFTRVDSVPDGSDESAFTQARFRGRFSFVRQADGTWIVRSANSVVSLSMDGVASWVERGSETADLLTHEQGHFDITALGARDFRNDAVALSGSSANDLQSQIDSARSSNQSTIDSVNSMYDEDPNCGTSHGTNAANQQQWNLRINNARTSGVRLSSIATCPSP
jgi:predicted secreted Zn-dependent protease